MSEDFDTLSLFAMAELSQLRAQALDLFDRCLVDRNPAPIVAFIERQVMSDHRATAVGETHRTLITQRRRPRRIGAYRPFLTSSGSVNANTVAPR